MRRSMLSQLGCSMGTGSLGFDFCDTHPAGMSISHVGHIIRVNLLVV